jgi:serine/threonine protein kinase
VRDVIYPTLCALAYMHSENIIHRDVKPENTLVAEDGAALLADFGLSMDCGLERPATRLGTLDYMAPEVLRCPDKDASTAPGPQLYDGKVDSWAVGILAFEVLVGRAPFEQDCKQTTCDLICYGDFVMPSFLSAQAKDFISRALCKNAAARPCIAELLAHAWVSGEARRTSGADRAASGGMGSFLLGRVFKDAGAKSAPATAAAGLRSRLPSAAPASKATPVAASSARFSPLTPPATARLPAAAQPRSPARV